jgi:hypothetical protein
LLGKLVLQAKNVRWHKSGSSGTAPPVIEPS